MKIVDKLPDNINLFLKIVWDKAKEAGVKFDLVIHDDNFLSTMLPVSNVNTTDDEFMALVDGTHAYYVVNAGELQAQPRVYDLFEYFAEVSSDPGSTYYNIYSISNDGWIYVPTKLDGLSPIRWYVSINDDNDVIRVACRNEYWYMELVTLDYSEPTESVRIIRKENGLTSTETDIHSASKLSDLTELYDKLPHQPVGSMTPILTLHDYVSFINTLIEMVQGWMES